MNNADADIFPTLERLLAEVRGLRSDIGRPPERWLSVEQAAEYAGISPRSLRGLIAGGKISVYRPVPGRVVVDRLQIDGHISSSTAAPRVRRGVAAAAASKRRAEA